MVEITKNQIPKLAIVGMDCFVGGCQTLDTFERSIYEGTQHFIPLPTHLNQNISAHETLPLGAYIQDFEINALQSKIPPEELDKFTKQELLMIKVADNALKDARLVQQTKIAVVIVAATELLDSQESTYIPNKLANYISQLWNAASPGFALTAEQNSVFQALNLAQKLLAKKQVDAVVVGAVDLSGLRNELPNVNTGIPTLSYDKNVNGPIVGEGAGAIVLKLHDTAKQNSDRIYAVIDALGLVEKSPLQPQAVTQACQEAFNLAGIKPTDIGYLEAFASGVQQQDEAEILGLIQAYQTAEANLSCAIGSVKANIGHTYAASGIISLVKTALCLHYRYIPAVPQWTSPKKPENWQSSPFYVVMQSKPWFLEPGASKRIAAINSIDIDDSYAHLILSEEPSQKERSSKYLEQMPLYLLAIAADDQSSLLEQLPILQQNITHCSSLSTVASQNFTVFQQRQQAPYTLVILGRNQDELIREIQRAIQGVTTAFNTGEPWQTPIGSYFTPKPLGASSKISFVYPGSFSSYLGISRNIFRLFPQIYDDPVISNLYTRISKVDKLIYPRSLNKLTKRQLESLEQKLIDHPVTMFESEVAFAGLMTTILKNYFQIQPHCAFGYSMGETSMMLAQGVWTNINQNDDALNSSPLFTTRLSGPKNAVREYWGLPLVENNQSEEIWSNYVLMSPESQVREVIKHEDRVYLALVNTPKEIIIAGETQACKRVIQTLNCDAFLAPINHVIHCEPMRSEYDNFAKLNTLPIHNIPETVFYSAAEYEPITLESHTLGNTIAKNLCQELNFTQLINRVYNDGCKIFIEVGVGSNCSRWISETLKQKEHTTVSLNRRGVDEHTSIVKALAKLLSHRVNMNLSPLYSLSQNNSISNQNTMKIISLDNSQNPASSVSDKNQQIVPNTNSDYPTNGVTQQHYPPAKSTNNLLVNKNHLPNLHGSHYQKLSDNHALISKSHAVLLHARQESLQQISVILQRQFALFQKLLT